MGTPLQTKINRFHILAAACATLSFGCSSLAKKEPEIEYRYAGAVKKTLRRSITATGQVVALTTVDVKSKAGGKVVKLAVDEGAVVKKGDLIALIDPADTQSVYDQADADLKSASAREQQAKKNLDIQIRQSKLDVDNAQASLAAAQARLRRAEIDAKRQPLLTSTNLAATQASYDSAKASLNKYERVTAPGLRRDATSNLNQARVALETAQHELDRQKELLAKGYVAGSAVDRAKSALEASKSAFDIATQRANTIEAEVETSVEAERKNVDRAHIALDEAKVNRVQDEFARRSYEEALQNVRVAETTLDRAKSNLAQHEVKREDLRIAELSKVKNRVSVDNAKIQLESTTVLAPRDGVVTLKYLEEGTIIPPGTSTFAQGTSLVQLSDVTQLYVECAVDEADISNVSIGQHVKVKADAYPGAPIDGEVTRVNPAAKTESNITAVKVRVHLKPSKKARIMPGMNASCEFITLEIPDALTVPSQAIHYDGDAATVKVKADGKKVPESRKVVLGESGNDDVEIKSGLKEGEQVVTAEIDVAAMRETQKKMQEAQQGGGLATGGGMGGNNRRPAAGGAGRGAGGGGGAPKR